MQRVHFLQAQQGDTLHLRRLLAEASSTDAAGATGPSAKFYVQVTQHGLTMPCSKGDL